MAGSFTAAPDDLTLTAKKIESALEPDTWGVENVVGSAAGHGEMSSAIDAFSTRWATARDLARHEVAMASSAMRQSAELYRSGDATAGENFWNFSL